MESSDPDFELLAASLRADSHDLNSFVEVLADKLQGALPQQTIVQRSGAGLFGRGEKRVKSVQVALGNAMYDLQVEGGRIRTGRAKAVRGIRLSSEELPLDSWIDDLSRDLAEHARTSERGRLALERLLTE